MITAINVAVFAARPAQQPVRTGSIARANIVLEKAIRNPAADSRSLKYPRRIPAGIWILGLRNFSGETYWQNRSDRAEVTKLIKVPSCSPRLLQADHRGRARTPHGDLPDRADEQGLQP